MKTTPLKTPRIKKLDAPNAIVDFFYGTTWGTIMLISTTIIESFYAFKLFSITGLLTFGPLVYFVALCYSLVTGGSVVFFTLRNNKLMVYSVVIFELIANYFLDYLTILNTNESNRVIYFSAQLLIGTLAPIATKAFAEEISKKEVQRIIGETNKQSKVK